MALSTPVKMHSSVKAPSSAVHFFDQQRKVQMVKVMPGGVYCTERAEMITTGLGSCVSACMWDSVARVGGLNHFLLPFDSADNEHHWNPDDVLSSASRYGSYAMEILINNLLKMGAQRQRLQIKLFGGAQMMGKHSMVGQKNVDFILSYVEKEHLRLVSFDLGGDEPRRILFDPLSGRLWLKRIPFHYQQHLVQDEAQYAKNLIISSKDDQSTKAELFL